MVTNVSGKLVISVLGKDRPGIIARVSTALAELGCNILDITQTVLRDSLFAMVMLVEMDESAAGFGEIKAKMDDCAAYLGMDISLRREEIFQAMHRI